MTMKVRIAHLEQEPAGRLFVSTVTVGKPEASTRAQVLEVGEAIDLTIESGQFLMIDETDPKEI